MLFRSMNDPRMATTLAGFVFVLVTPFHTASANDTAFPEVAFTKARSGTWLILKSENFRVCTQSPGLFLDHVPGLSESLRSALQATWFDQQQAPDWSPRCDVIVHRTLAGYTRSLGPSVGNSVGCATIGLDAGRVVSRRIDIRLDDDDWTSDALPHELTHVVLADRFSVRRIPPWADEGLGVLAESSEKQSLRASALSAADARATERSR